MKINFQGTAAIIGDLHIPFQDQRALREVELFLGELQPSLILYVGDIADFYELSKFDKNPARTDTLQKDMDAVDAMFKRHNNLCPDARKILLFGNHEDRLRRYLCGDGKPIASLDSNTVEYQYNLAENGVEWVAQDEVVMVNDRFMVSHGDIIRAHSAYTAKGMSDKHGGSGIHGHSHRLGSYYKRNRFGVYGWWENGCLCTLTPDWISWPNWQQGFSLVHFSRDRFWVEVIQIINRKFVYAGKLYGSGGKKR